MPDNAARTMRQGRAGIVRAMLLLVRGYSAEKNLWLTAPIWPVKHDKDMEACQDMSDKSKPALSLVTPQARHRYTRLDQMNQLVGASEADPEIGFMARMMALCSLPRSNPGNRLRYVRRNGPYALVMTAGGLSKLPFGNLPRLLLAWVCTEAVRTQSRDIVLGRSLSDFMRALGVYDSSGRTQARLRTQMKRLFGCSVSLVYQDERREATASALIADLTDFWWNPKRPDQPSLWKSKIQLSENFFNEIIEHPVPIDMNTLSALKRSPLGLDLYLWLAYRTFTLQHPLRLTWKQVYHQFGADPAKASDNQTVQNFRYKVLRELKKIKLAWPKLNCGTARGVLVVYPSTPIIPPTGHRQLAG